MQDLGCDRARGAQHHDRAHRGACKRRLRPGPPLRRPSTRRDVMYARPGGAPRSVGPRRDAPPWLARSTFHGRSGGYSLNSAFDNLYVPLTHAVTTYLWEVRRPPVLVASHRRRKTRSPRRTVMCGMILVTKIRRLCTRHLMLYARQVLSQRPWRATHLCWIGS